MREVGDNRFGDALRRARENARLTQAELAKLVSADDWQVTGASVGNWERGDNPPGNADRVFRIEHALGLRPGELSHYLGFVPYGSEPPLAEDALLADDAISPDVREALLAAYRQARGRPQGG